MAKTEHPRSPGIVAHRRLWFSGALILLVATVLAISLLLRGSLFFGPGSDSQNKNGRKLSGLGGLENKGRLSGIAYHQARFDERFENWLEMFQSRVKGAEFKWRPGATSEEIEALETWAGGLPVDLKHLLRKHNGQEENATAMHFTDRLLNSSEIRSETIMLAEIHGEFSDQKGSADQPIGDTWWHPSLILFLSDDNGGGVAIDRRNGEVWSWDHDGGLFGMIAPNITTFLEWMALALEERRFDGPTYYSSPSFSELDPSKLDR